MGSGLTFDECRELKLKPHSRADRAFHQAVEQSWEEMFPMQTVAASHRLRSLGYDCRPEMLELLVKDGTVRLAEPDTWNRAEMEEAAAYLEQCQLFVPYVAMCDTLGCRYADFLRSLREASERESKKYGRHIPADDQYFVMHRQPPRGVTGEDGELLDIMDAVITFTLCDDIRERLERGEEI